MRLLRLLISAAALLLLPAVSITAFGLVLRLAGRRELLFPLLAGTICGAAFDWYVVRRRLPVFGTFEHELTHAAASLLFFRRVHRFVVTMRSGGHIVHSGGFGGGFGDDFIGLAPYLLPTFTAIAVLITPLIGLVPSAWWVAFVGLTFGYHTCSGVREIARNWTGAHFLSTSGEVTNSDIARRGFVYSAIYITTATLAIHGLLLAILLDGYAGAAVWARLVWPQAVATLIWLAERSAGMAHALMR